MMPTHADYGITALCLWREARGEGQLGMTAVACVLRNRVHKHSSTYFTEVTKPYQFTSISVKGNPQLTLFPSIGDTNWVTAQLVTGNVIDEQVSDVTNGATLYWNPAGIVSTKMFVLPDGSEVKFPETWDPAAVVWAATIGHHIFLKEV